MTDREQRGQDPYRTPVPNEVDALRERVARLEVRLADALSRLAKVESSPAVRYPYGYGGLGS